MSSPYIALSAPLMTTPTMVQPEIRIALKAVLLKLHAKVAPGWALIRVNFDPIQKNWAKSRGWLGALS